MKNKIHQRTQKEQKEIDNNEKSKEKKILYLP